MVVSKADLAIYQGDDYAAVVHVRDAANQPVNITGYTAAAQLRRKVADDDSAVAAVITATVVSPDVYLAISHTVTAQLTGRYVWDLQLISGAGAITTIMDGGAIVTAEVTRAIA